MTAYQQPSRLRLAFVTQWFSERQEAAPSLAIAEQLRRRGLVVRVSSAPAPGYFNQNRIDPRARRFHLWRDTLREIGALRSPSYQTQAPSTVKRTLSVVSFAISSTWFGLGLVRNADAVLVYASPGPAALSAVVGRMLGGAPYVLFVQDLWPDAITASGYLGGPVSRRLIDATVGRFMQFAHRKAAAVLAITPGMHSALLERGLDPDLVHLLYNWVDESAFHPEPENHRLRSMIGADSDEVVLVYAGNHGRPQGLHAWVAAMGRVPADVRVRLVCIGSGVERQRLIAAAEGNTRVTFLPATPATELASLVADCDAMVVSLVDDPVFRMSLPSKLQTCLAMGKAVLCSAPGETARVVRESGSGLTCRPEDAEAIAQMIQHAAAMGRTQLRGLGSAGLTYYRDNMSAQVGAARLTSIIEQARRAQPRT